VVPTQQLSGSIQRYEKNKNNSLTLLMKMRKKDVRRIRVKVFNKLEGLPLT